MEAVKLKSNKKCAKKNQGNYKYFVLLPIVLWSLLHLHIWATTNTSATTDNMESSWNKNQIKISFICLRNWNIGRLVNRSKIYFKRIKTPEVIINDTSNGTRYAIAISTELKAIEKRQPENRFIAYWDWCCFVMVGIFSWYKPHAVAMFITNIAVIAVMVNA